MSYVSFRLAFSLGSAQTLLFLFSRGRWGRGTADVTRQRIDFAMIRGGRLDFAHEGHQGSMANHNPSISSLRDPQPEICLN